MLRFSHSTMGFIAIHCLRDSSKLHTAHGKPRALQRRHGFIVAWGYFLGLMLAISGWAQTHRLEHVTLSVPGPAGSVSLPIELAQRIGADKAEGLALSLKFVNGGGVAIDDLLNGNADFGIFGLPAAMLHNLKKPSLVALAAVDGRPLYSLVVRADLRSKVSRIEDLRGRKIGIHTDSLVAQTTSRQILNLVLRQNGIKPDEIAYIAAGQSWETQSALFIGRLVDAIMSDEPFGTRFSKEKLGFTIYSTGDTADASSTPGAGFLRAALIARKDTVEANPEVARRMVKVVQRSLQWIATHKSEEIADAMAMSPSRRASFVDVSRKFPNQYSPDGKFSKKQLVETGIFFRNSNSDWPDALHYKVDHMIIERWSGSKP